MDLTNAEGRAALGRRYRDALLEDVVPFWLRHGLDREQGGYFTCLDRDGTVVDTDKSIWFQGRGAWTFATLFLDVGDPALLDAARLGIAFLRRYGPGPDGKLRFTTTRDGKPLRTRRYVFSEAFAAIAEAAYSRAANDARAADEATRHFARYLDWSFSPGKMPPKVDPATRPTQGIGPMMIGIATAQELRRWLGDVAVAGKTCTQHIDDWIARIERDFLKRDERALMETVGPSGEIVDHFDGRLLNPGHAIECAWFVLHEAKLRSDRRLVELGATILDWMWERGWDAEFGGLFYFRDLRNLPVAEYWHEMKFWWPHCEALIATLLAYDLTGEPRFAEQHRLVHDWSFRHFADPEHGEWYGYLRRDGTPSSRLKGTLWKGPFHLPRALHVCWRQLDPKPA